MTEPLKFEVGKHYRTIDDRKLLCIWVFGNGSGLFVNEKSDTYEYHLKDSPEFVSEWREPETIDVEVWQSIASPLIFRAETGNEEKWCGRFKTAWRPFARVAVTEGEGLE